MSSLFQLLARTVWALLPGGSTPSRPFRLKTVITSGEGLAIDGEWTEVRSLIYEEHGG